MKAEHRRHGRGRHYERGPRRSRRVRLDGPPDLRPLLLDANLVPLALEDWLLLLMLGVDLLLLLRKPDWNPSTHGSESRRRPRSDASDLHHRPPHLRLRLLLHDRSNRRDSVRPLKAEASVVLEARERAGGRDPSRTTGARSLVRTGKGRFGRGELLRGGEEGGDGHAGASRWVCGVVQARGGRVGAVLKKGVEKGVVNCFCGWARVGLRLWRDRLAGRSCECGVVTLSPNAGLSPVPPCSAQSPVLPVSLSLSHPPSAPLPASLSNDARATGEREPTSIALSRTPIGPPEASASSTRLNKTGSCAYKVRRVQRRAAPDAPDPSLSEGREILRAWEGEGGAPARGRFWPCVRVEEFAEEVEFRVFKSSRFSRNKTRSSSAFAYSQLTLRERKLSSETATETCRPSQDSLVETGGTPQERPPLVSYGKRCILFSYTPTWALLDKVDRAQPVNSGVRSTNARLISRKRLFNSSKLPSFCSGCVGRFSSSFRSYASSAPRGEEGRLPRDPLPLPLASPSSTTQGVQLLQIV